MKKWLRVKVLRSRSRVQTQVSAGPSLSKDAPLPCPGMVIHIAPVPGRTLAATSGTPPPREHAAVRTGSKEVSAGRAAWNPISGPAVSPGSGGEGSEGAWENPEAVRILPWPQFRHKERTRPPRPSGPQPGLSPALAARVTAVTYDNEINLLPLDVSSHSRDLFPQSLSCPHHNGMRHTEGLSGQGLAWSLNPAQWSFPTERGLLQQV